MAQQHGYDVRMRFRLCAFPSTYGASLHRIPVFSGLSNTSRVELQVQSFEGFGRDKYQMQRYVTPSRKMTWALKMVKYCQVQLGYLDFSCWVTRKIAHSTTTANICNFTHSSCIPADHFQQCSLASGPSLQVVNQPSIGSLCGF